MSDFFLDDPNWESELPERNRAMWSHLGAMLGIVIPPINVIVPFIIYNQQKNKSAFVKDHAAKATNFQIVILILMLATYLVFSYLHFMLGIYLGVGTLAIHLYGTINAAIKAKSGYKQNYPITLISILK